MSSTNRSNAREAHVSDYYVTPALTIKSFLNAINQDNKEFLDGILSTDPAEKMAILDPCAGGDASHLMAYPEAIKNYSGWEISYTDTVDIREDSLANIKADYLQQAQHYENYDVIITNPPFNIAMEIIIKALDEVCDGGLVIMLLRLNFFGSMQRQKFFQENMPVLTYVHTKRPSFMPEDLKRRIIAEAKAKGEKPQGVGTDSIEYMHCCWRSGQNCKHTALRIID